MQFYGHLFHQNGRSEMWGPFADAGKAIEKIKLVHSNYDDACWSAAVSENDGIRDPDDCDKFLWYQECGE